VRDDAEGRADVWGGDGDGRGGAAVWGREIQGPQGGMSGD
jgi:hypothetical protein